jgi:hypothetical protein
MRDIKVKAARGGWRVWYGEELISVARDEAGAFQAALDYCSQLFQRGVRAPVTLDRPALKG